MASDRSKASGARLLMQLARVHHAQIRASQLELLLTVWLQPGLNQTELADQLGLSLSAVSKAVDVLGTTGRKDKLSSARLGLLAAERDANDERTRLICLTAAGELLVRSLINSLR
jgi:DNA-binding MarR family transcriptional regulator